MGRFVILGLIGLSMLVVISSRHTVAANVPIIERPLIIEQDQGEVRVWRPLQRDPGWEKISFTIKVDKQNGGSPDFWFVTESLPPRAEIQFHRHLHEDEVLYIGSGIAHLNVGSLEGDAHAGSMVFIPRDTWVSLKNVGKTPIALLAAFNAPGFDRYMRCESVLKGQPAPRMTTQQDRHCEHLGDVQYR